MTKTIALTPVKATKEIMRDLEDRGLIIRLAPGCHELAPPLGVTDGYPVYAADTRMGPHILLSVTVNTPTFSAFGYHPDNEEFILIGDTDTKPMYLLIAKMYCEELERKINAGTLSADDFILLDTTYNDPECSLFVMKARVPHGEATTGGVGKPPSFYVTEPGAMGSVKTDFKEYVLSF